MANKGITLIEILIVVAILGVLFSIVLIALGGKGKKSSLPTKTLYEERLEQAVKSCPNGLEKFESQGFSGDYVFTCK